LARGLETFCRNGGLEPEVEQDLNLALEELFVNSVKHGGCLGMKDAVRIALASDGDVVRIEFRDRGTAFDPTAHPGPQPSGGLGLHLLRQVTQEIHYRREGEWNCVSMVRRTGQ